MTIPALILGDDPFNGLGVARNLGRLGIPVVRVGTQRTGLLRSRYIRRTWAIAELEACDDDTLVAHLEAVAGELAERAVLFPISDLYVLRVARLRDRLAAHFRIITCDLATAETLVNKQRFGAFLEQHDVPHPRTRSIRSREDLDAAGELQYPIFVKPEISPAFARVFGSKGFVAGGLDELRERLQQAWDADLSVIVQEIIPGPARNMVGCAGVRRGGRIQAMCYRRIREYPLGFGCGTYLETVPSIVDETSLVACLEALGYEGVFDAEFKQDERDGHYKLIEINARTWWQNTLPTQAGLNIVHVAYRGAVAPEQPLAEGAYRTGVTWACLSLDLKSARESGQSIAAWLQSLSGTRTFAILAADDLLPFMFRLGRLLKR